MPTVADIVKVEAPSEAVAGETVIVDVYVKNIATAAWDITVAGSYEPPLSLISFQFDVLLVAAGETVIFKGNFDMPSNSVKVKLYAYRKDYDTDDWVLDDQAEVDITFVLHKLYDLRVSYAAV